MGRYLAAYAIEALDGEPLWRTDGCLVLQPRLLRAPPKEHDRQWHRVA